MTGNDFLAKKVQFSDGEKSLREFLREAAQDSTGKYFSVISSWGYPLTAEGMDAIKSGTMDRSDAVLKVQFFLTSVETIASDHTTYGFNEELASRLHAFLGSHWENIYKLYLIKSGEQIDGLFESLRPIALEWLKEADVRSESSVRLEQGR